MVTSSWALSDNAVHAKNTKARRQKISHRIEVMQDKVWTNLTNEQKEYNRYLVKKGWKKLASAESQQFFVNRLSVFLMTEDKENKSRYIQPLLQRTATSKAFEVKTMSSSPTK